MLRRTYDWMLRLAASREAPGWLAILAFCEGIFFPIPPDVMLAPLVLTNRNRAWAYAGICLTASVLGGSVGYTVGFFLHPVGIWLLSLTGSDPHQFEHWYHQWGVLLLAIPIPYKLTAIASGLFKLSFPVFFGASILIRGLRFFLVAGLIRTYGAPMQAFVEKRMGLVVSAVALALIGLVLVLRFAV
ncbi:MAG TPA: DedA family protein [Caulobacteraceae bacterium]|jgi:membrane protein YqaA with SNARE-associated domain